MGSPAREGLERRLQLQQEMIAKLVASPETQSNPKDAYPIICRAAACTLHIERASIWILDPIKDELFCECRYVASTDDKESGDRISTLDAAAYLKALKETRSVDVADVKTDPRTKELAAPYLSEAETTSLLSSRIRHSGKIVGAICLESVGPQRQWQIDELIFAERLSDKVATLLSSWELTKSNRMFQLVIDTIPVRVFWKDSELNYLGCNLSFAQDAGRESPEDVVGDNDYNMGWRDQAELYRSDDQHVIDTGEGKVDFVEPQTTPDGQKIWLRTSKIPIRDRENKIMGVLGTYQDVTDQRQLEERLRHAEKMDSIGQLAGGVAHDFNNMLSGIVGAAEILADKLKDNSDLSKFVSIIEDASDRASELTRKLLAFSRKANVTNAPVDLHKIITETIELLQRSIDKGIHLEIDFAAASSVLVGDSAQLNNAFLNLALNSRDALSEGGTIKFSTSNIPMEDFDPEAASKDPTAQAIVIRVQDNGCGMSDETVEHIFEPFFTTKEIGKGTGLGLSAVYGTVREHKGQIKVHSEIGVGTEFRITLPTVNAKDVGRKSNKRSRVKGEGLVLLVDDEQIVQTITASMLRELGYETIIADNGKEAVTFLKENCNRICIILLDIVMPEMGGTEAYYQLKEVCPNVPIVLCSGFTQDQRVDRLLNDGASGFLQKPYSIDRLGEIIETNLR